MSIIPEMLKYTITSCISCTASYRIFNLQITLGNKIYLCIFMKKYKASEIYFRINIYAQYLCSKSLILSKPSIAHICKFPIQTANGFYSLIRNVLWYILGKESLFLYAIASSFKLSRSISMVGYRKKWNFTGEPKN